MKTKAFAKRPMIATSIVASFIQDLLKAWCRYRYAIKQMKGGPSGSAIRSLIPRHRKLL
jgi:hypothetical protein